MRLSFATGCMHLLWLHALDDHRAPAGSSHLGLRPLPPSPGSGVADRSRASLDSPRRQLPSG
eukprot:1781520-Alexandrium_andersonii.AAC.1